MRWIYALSDLTRPVEDAYRAAADLSAESWPDALRLIKAHHLESVVFWRLRQVAPEPLRQAALLAQTRLLLGQALLQHVAQTLDRRRIRWMLLKGPAIERMCYPDLGLRGSVDVDIAVDPAAWTSTHEALARTGMTCLELLPFKPGSVWGWQLAPGASMTLDVHFGHFLMPPFGALWDRRQSIELPGLRCWTWSVEHTLLFLALHLAFTHWDAPELLWCLDLKLMLSACTIKWDRLLKSAQRYGVVRAVARSFDMVRRTFGLPPVRLPPPLAAYRPWAFDTVDRDWAHPLPIRRIDLRERIYFGLFDGPISKTHFYGHRAWYRLLRLIDWRRRG